MNILSLALRSQTKSNSLVLVIVETDRITKRVHISRVVGASRSTKETVDGDRQTLTWEEDVQRADMTTLHKNLICPYPVRGHEETYASKTCSSGTDDMAMSGWGRQKQRNTVAKGEDEFSIRKTSSRPNIYTRTAAKVSN